MASYITRDELVKWGFNSQALERFSNDDMDAAIEAASSELEDAIGSSYSLPLTAVPNSFKLHLARAATFHLMTTKGFDPEGPDGLILANYKMAMKYFEKHAQGLLVANPNDVTPGAAALPELDAEDDRGFARGKV